VQAGTIIYKNIILHSYIHINSVMVSWDCIAWIIVIRGQEAFFFCSSLQLETNIAIVLAT
jgi:hypothetical protein